MSKKITHEEAFQFLMKLVSIDHRLKGREEVDLLKWYIKEQEKQEKLLELSLKLNNLWRNKGSYTNSFNMIIDLENQIKELKNDWNTSRKVCSTLFVSQ